MRYFGTGCLLKIVATILRGAAMTLRFFCPFLRFFNFLLSFFRTFYLESLILLLLCTFVLLFMCVSIFFVHTFKSFGLFLSRMLLSSLIAQYDTALAARTCCH